MTGVTCACLSRICSSLSPNLPYKGLQHAVLPASPADRRNGCRQSCSMSSDTVNSLRRTCRFGFNVGMGMVDGLWAGGTAAATDFALITYQLRLLGYNAGEAQGVAAMGGTAATSNKAQLSLYDLPRPQCPQGHQYIASIEVFPDEQLTVTKSMR